MLVAKTRPEVEGVVLVFWTGKVSNAAQINFFATHLARNLEQNRAKHCHANIQVVLCIVWEECWLVVSNASCLVGWQTSWLVEKQKACMLKGRLVDWKV